MSEEITKDTQPTTEPTPGATGGQGGEKTFTQDEVNRIVSERLARDRVDRAKPTPEDEREQALKARESRLDCRDYLDSKKLPGDLLEILDTSDVEKFKAAADKLAALLPGEVAMAARVTTRLGESPVKEDPISEAFKPKI